MFKRFLNLIALFVQSLVVFEIYNSGGNSLVSAAQIFLVGNGLVLALNYLFWGKLIVWHFDSE